MHEVLAHHRGHCVGDDWSTYLFRSETRLGVQKKMKILAIGIGTAVVSGGLALYDHFKPKKAIQGGTSPGTQGKVILLGKVEKWAADQIHPSPIVSNPVSAGGSDPFAPKLPVAPNFLQSLWQADKITPPAPAQSYGTPN